MMNRLLSLSLVLVLVQIAASSVNLSDVKCGKLSRGSRRLFARIMGGVPIEITDVPHAVSLQKNGIHHCGGSLISKDHVLTAAHCVHSYPAPLFSVAVGAQNSYHVDDEGKGAQQVIKVAEIIKHPDYVFPKFVDDIAIMRLEEPVEWTPSSQPICLPQSDRRTGRDLGYLAGWGYDGERDKGGHPTEDIHMAKLPIMENDQCEDWFKSQGKRIKLKESHLCAGHETGQTDGCQSDSGGGLVVLDQNELVLVGVMSAGIGCGREKSPGIYARVETYTPWIQQVMESNRVKRDIAQSKFTDNEIWNNLEDRF